MSQEGECAHGVSIELGDFVPPGLVERLMAACYVLGRHHYFWRRPHGAGALIKAFPNAASTAGSEARLLLDVDEVAHVGEWEGGDENAENSDAEMPMGAAAATIGLRRPHEYVMRFEVFASRAIESDAEALLLRAQTLMEHLLSDFPGMVASSLQRAARWKPLIYQ